MVIKRWLSNMSLCFIETRCKDSEIFWIEQEKSPWRAIFFGVECKGRDICQTTGKNKTGGGRIREIPKCYLGKWTNNRKEKWSWLVIEPLVGARIEFVVGGRAWHGWRQGIGRIVCLYQSMDQWAHVRLGVCHEYWEFEPHSDGGNPRAKCGILPEYSSQGFD